MKMLHETHRTLIKFMGEKPHLPRIPNLSKEKLLSLRRTLRDASTMLDETLDAMTQQKIMVSKPDTSLKQESISMDTNESSLSSVRKSTNSKTMGFKGLTFKTSPGFTFNKGPIIPSGHARNKMQDETLSAADKTQSVANKNQSVSVTPTRKSVEDISEEQLSDKGLKNTDTSTPSKRSTPTTVVPPPPTPPPPLESKFNGKPLNWV